MTNWVVTHGDVESHPEFGVLSLDIILHSFGMDVSKEYESDGRVQGTLKPYKFGFKSRSPFTGKVHEGVRYVGTARTDGRWKQFTETFHPKSQENVCLN